MTTRNLRREARVEARVPVVVVRGRQTVALETFDVSFRGLSLRTGEPLPLRSLVRLRVTLPNGEIEVHAMVVHVVKQDDGVVTAAGLQFWGLSGAALRAWDDFIRARIYDVRERARLAAARAQLSVPTPSGIRVVTDPPPSPKRASEK